MDSVSENSSTVNAGSVQYPCWLYFEFEEVINKRAKIRGFYTTIHRFIFRIINKTVQFNRNEMHRDRSTDLNEERPHNRHLTRDE